MCKYNIDADITGNTLAIKSVGSGSQFVKLLTKPTRASLSIKLNHPMTTVLLCDSLAQVIRRGISACRCKPSFVSTTERALPSQLATKTDACFCRQPSHEGIPETRMNAIYVHAMKLLFRRPKKDPRQ
jgi:hypothetical protein